MQESIKPVLSIVIVYIPHPLELEFDKARSINRLKMSIEWFGSIKDVRRGGLRLDDGIMGLLFTLMISSTVSVYLISCKYRESNHLAIWFVRASSWAVVMVVAGKSWVDMAAKESQGTVFPHDKAWCVMNQNFSPFSRQSIFKEEWIRDNSWGFCVISPDVVYDPCKSTWVIGSTYF